MLLFGSTLYLVFKIFQKLIPNFDIIDQKINFNSELSNTKYIVIFSVISISMIFVFEFLLIGMGSFFSNSNFLACSNLEMMKNFRELFKQNDFILKFHQPVKIIAELKYMVFFIIGEIYRNYNSNYQIKIIYYSFFIAILILAIIKGSKLFWIIYYFIYFFNRKKCINLKIA